MEQVALRSAERVRSLVETRRRAEAELVVSLCELAEHYRVDTDDLIEVLAERRVRVGGSGTPSVSEFLALEVAGLLGCTPAAAGHRVVEALNLKHRHPQLFSAVRRLEVDADRALRAAARCGDLEPGAADAVTSRWAGPQRRLGWTAAFTLLDRLIVEADPVSAAEKERRAREDRGVFVWGFADGCMNLTGRLDVLDARYLDAAVERLAEVLQEQHPELTRDQRRAKAVGVLAHPAYATALLQTAAQQMLPLPGEGDAARGPQGSPPLARTRPQLPVAEPPAPPFARVDLSHEELLAYRPDVAEPDGASGAQAVAPGKPACATDESGADPPEDVAAPGVPVSAPQEWPHADQPAGRGDPHGCLGHLCGAIDVPLAKLRPQVGLAVHIHADAVGHLSGAARVERAGAITLDLLRDLLDGVNVTVQPVIDLPEFPVEDRYVPSGRMRRAIALAFDHEAFPFSARPTDRLDLDHTEAYRPGRRGQTRVGNLAPLSRRAHRAKTAGVWQVDQARPGILVWTSPLGYRYEVSPSGTRMLS